MSYVKHIIQPGEEVVMIGHLHWIIYRNAILLALVALAIFIYGYVYYHVRFYCVIAGGVVGVVALLFFLPAWFRKMITEIAVTNKRIIHKVGFISQRTTEMNIDKVETVAVDQSVLGRLFDYGTINIKGTGQGIEDLRYMAQPIALRNAIEAR
jgi:uncharacterized membrane protein YdbT with pleckstrin-like domain